MQLHLIKYLREFVLEMLLPVMTRALTLLLGFPIPQDGVGFWNDGGVVSLGSPVFSIGQQTSPSPQISGLFKRR